jgi:hypothetical protein
MDANNNKVTTESISKPHNCIFFDCEKSHFVPVHKKVIALKAKVSNTILLP